MRVALRRAFAALLCLAALSGCAAPPESEEPPEPSWEDYLTPSPSGETQTAFSDFTLPCLDRQSFDPITCPDGVQQTVASLLYEGLFALDDRFEPQCVLCSDWSCDRAALTYTFTLREDAAFSDGSPLTADDVLATYRRAADSARFGARFGNIASMDSSGGRELTLTLRAWDASLPALLDVPIVKKGTEQRDAPLGTGPYVYEPDGPALLASTLWWQKLPLPVERFALLPVKDENAAAQAFTSGDAGLLSLDLTALSTIYADVPADLTDAPSTAMLYLGFNTSRAVFSDAALRRAFGCAIDREQLVRACFASHARSAQFPLSPASPLYPTALEQSCSPQDYEAAAATLLSDGSQELSLLVNEENVARVAAAEQLARWLSTDRLACTVLALPWEEYCAALEAGEFDLYLAEARLPANWDCGALLHADGALNFGAYFSVLTERALAAFLADPSDATVRDLCERLRDEAPFVPLAFKNVTVLRRQGLTDEIAPTASAPFAGLSRWTVHLIEE